MSFSIKHIASLARLELKKEEEEKFESQLSSILDYVKKLQKAETEEIESIFQDAQRENVTREDKIQNVNEETRQGILDNLPEREGDFVKVKAVFE